MKQAPGLSNRADWTRCRWCVVGFLWWTVACEADRPQLDVPVSSIELPEAASPTVLRVTDTIISIGVQAGNSAQEFGRIRSAAFDEAHRLYLLDEFSSSIRVFDTTGAHLGEVGSVGMGPGQFARPIKLFKGENGELHVLDAYSGISIYETREAGPPVYRSRNGLVDNLVATDLCDMQGAPYVYGLVGEHVVSRMQSGHRAIDHSFGTLFGPSDGPLLRRVLSGAGRLACLDAAETLIVAATPLPEVRAYAPSGGELLWSMELPEFVQVQAHEENGTYTMSGGAEGYDQLAELVVMDSRRVLIQWTRSRRDLGTIGVRSCMLDVRVAECTFYTEDLPLLRAVSFPLAIAVDESAGFPLVSVVRLEFGG